LDKISWSLGNADVLSHDYTLDARGRRTAAAREDGTLWDYGYNERGEVTSASHLRANDTVLPGRGFGYTFDAIGNRTESRTDFQSVPPTQTTAYQANALNQYTTITRTNPLRRIVQGLAHPNATIEVRHDSPTGQSRTVARVEPSGAGFIAEAEADIALAGVWRQVVVDAERPGVGVNGGPVRTRKKGWLFFPPQNETLVYDKDGNLKEDARWHYTWDGENRLITQEEKAIANATPAETPPPRKRLEFAYDGQSRRVRKAVYQRSTTNEEPGTTWVLKSDLRFVYDAWNLLAELEMKPGTSNLELLRSYAWGYDLSGTEQGAGGVGGLVLVKSRDAGSTTVNNSNPPSTSLAPCYDGNGNILAYLDCTTGTPTQRMEYDAFGNEMTLDSVLEGRVASTREVPFRFSTKYTDSEMSLCYYGFRYYSPELGRWLSRDPIGERGGLNLYGMVSNDPVNKWDYLGQDVGVANPYGGPSDGFNYPEGAGHYFGGSGKDVDVPFSSIDGGWTVKDFITPCDYASGSSHKIDSIKKVPVDLYSISSFFTNAGPGRITVRIKGTLYRKKSSSPYLNTVADLWQFDGRMTADDDPFDFDPRPWNERGILKEAVTQIVNAMPAGKSFTVHFTGGRDVHETGSCGCEKK